MDNHLYFEWEQNSNFPLFLFSKKACCFMNLQENLHNAIYIKLFYFWMAYLDCILNAHHRHGRYIQNLLICDMQLVTWSLFFKADLIRYSNYLFVISRYNHSHFINLISVVILCFVNLLRKQEAQGPNCSSEHQ